MNRDLKFVELEQKIEAEVDKELNENIREMYAVSYSLPHTSHKIYEYITEKIENVFKEFLLCTYPLVAICSVAFLIDISIHLFSRAFGFSFSNLGLFRALINQQNCSLTVEESLYIHT